MKKKLSEINKNQEKYNKDDLDKYKFKLTKGHYKKPSGEQIGLYR